MAPPALDVAAFPDSVQSVTVAVPLKLFEMAPP